MTLFWILWFEIICFPIDVLLTSCILILRIYFIMETVYFFEWLISAQYLRVLSVTFFMFVAYFAELLLMFTLDLLPTPLINYQRFCANPVTGPSKNRGPGPMLPLSLPPVATPMIWLVWCVRSLSTEIVSSRLLLQSHCPHTMRVSSHGLSRGTSFR